MRSGVAIGACGGACAVSKPALRDARRRIDTSATASSEALVEREAMRFALSALCLVCVVVPPSPTRTSPGAPTNATTKAAVVTLSSVASLWTQTRGQVPEERVGKRMREGVEGAVHRGERERSMETEGLACTCLVGGFEIENR